MKMHIVVFCILCIPCVLWAQANKIKNDTSSFIIKKNDTTSLLQLYCGARNNVNCIGFGSITRIWFSNPIVYAEKIGEDNLYQIIVDPILYRDTIYGTLIMKLFSYKECVATYALPNPIAADVEIICYDSLHHIINFKEGVAKYNGLISFKAMLSAPDYVRIYKRYRGVFVVTLQDSMKTNLNEIYGWYDSGDMSRPFDSREYSNAHSFIYFWIDEKRMRRLGDEYIKEGITDIKLKKGFSNPLKLNF